MSLARISIKANGTERLVIVNEHDISAEISDIFVDIKVGDVPRCGVSFLNPEYEFEGEGIVAVSQLIEQDPRELILGFLESVDTASIEARALEQGGLEESPAVSFIEALKELLR